MNLEYYYWYFKSALSEKTCDEILKHGKSQQDQLAVVGNINPEDIKNKKTKVIKDLKKKRNSNIVWLSDKWIYDEIHPFIHKANKNAGWNFDWDYSEACQFTKYNKNQFYDWHCDSWNSPYNNPENSNINGKIRKLSVTVSLTDPKNYKGGGLEFDFKNNNKNSIIECKEIRPRGSIVIFPSFVYHRVKPVTKGTRYSLVIWNLGHPFK